MTFGGGLALGNLLLLSGLSDGLAARLIGLGARLTWLVILMIASLALALGAVVSNTATAAMLIPLAIPLARSLHVGPRLLVGVVAVASSIDFAPVVGTPPTMLACSTGLFQVREIFRRGIVLDVIGVLLLSFVVIRIWRLLGAVVF